MRSVIVISRYTKQVNGDLIPAVFLSPLQGVTYSMITPQVDANLDDGDVCCVQVDGLTAGQLTAAKGRADVIYLTDGDNGTGREAYTFLNDKPSKAELTDIAQKLSDLFRIPLAKIQKWVDVNGKPTRLEIIEIITKLVMDGKPKRATADKKQ